LVEFNFQNLVAVPVENKVNLWKSQPLEKVEPKINLWKSQPLEKVEPKINLWKRLSQKSSKSKEHNFNMLYKLIIFLYII